MKKRISSIIIGIILFFIYFYFFDITDLIFKLINFDITKCSKTVIWIYIYGIELLPVIILILAFRKDFKKDLNNFKNNTLKDIETYLNLWILALVLMTLASTIISIITSNPLSNNEEAVRNVAKVLPIYSFITTCFIAPIGEELAFRKCFKKIFKDKWVSIVMSGIVFGLVHVIGTYKSIIDLLYIIPYGLYGLILMYMYDRSDSIFTTISVHFIHNTVITITLLLRGII